MLLPDLVNGVGMFNGCRVTQLPANMVLDNLSISGTGNSNGAMFQGCPLTDLPIGMTLKGLTRGTNMFLSSNINTARYSKLLQDLDNLNPNLNVSLHAGSSKYNSSASVSRSNLIAKGYTLTDGGLA